MNLRVALQLGRVSNLPTVWTNVMAGVVLAGGAPGDGRVPWLLAAMSLCYVAGMFLNDAFDRDFDARYRPERPIPSGATSAAAVSGAGFGMLAAGVAMLTWVGFGYADGTAWRPVAAGFGLAAAIVYYDWHHKANRLSPFVMGLCRMLVYVAAAYAIAHAPPAQVFLLGLLLLSYLVGLTYVAKQEHLGAATSLWPLVFIALPVLWGISAATRSALAAVLVLSLTAWVLYALSLLLRRGPGDVPRAVGHMIAGICLWDALVMAVAGQPSLAAVAVALFILTLLAQRFVSPT